MKSDHPEGSLHLSEGSLDELLDELSYEPAGALAVSHQAPAGLRQRILLAQQATTSKAQQPESRFTQWLRSPWRAIAASAAPLLLGILLGSNTSAAEFYEANIDPQSYPDNDQLLVIASLDSDFTATLGQELLLDWPQNGESNLTAPASPGATSP